MIAAAFCLGALLAAGELPGTAPPPDAPLAGDAAPASARDAVAVRQPPAGDAVLGEASTRIRAELAASGIASSEVDCAPTGAAAPAGCPSSGAGTLISLSREDGLVEIDVSVRLPDGLELRRHVHVLARAGGEDPSVLAVRAVELLRDLRLNARPRRTAGPPAPASDDEEPQLPAPSPPPPPRWRIALGLAGLGSPPAWNRPGVSPALGPSLTGGAAVDPHVIVLGTLAGPFDNSISPLDAHGASLLQLLGWVEVRYRFSLPVVEPFVGASLGVNYLRASFSYASQVATAWMPLFGAAAGVTRTFHERFFAWLDVHVFVTDPPEVVRLDGQDAAQSGAPSILAGAGLGLFLR